MEHREEDRLLLQADLDAGKSQADRNKLGQYATPTLLATQILQYAKTRFPRSTKVRFLDPAFGTGAFYSALLRAFPRASIDRAVGYEVDPHYSGPAQVFWRDSGLLLEQTDFTALTPPPSDDARFNLVICNPPYVRHHHIQNGDKLRLRHLAAQTAAVHLNGLTGLYCYFIALSHPWMAPGAIAAWLVPSEFMDVNYGRGLKDYLLSRVTLLRVHRYDPATVQFDDALVSSAVLFFRNSVPRPEHSVLFTYGGTLVRPAVKRQVSLEALRDQPKWTRYPQSEPHCRSAALPTIGDLFTIKRGLATGDNSFFILSEERLAHAGLRRDAGYTRPILPSPRFLKVSEIYAHEDGYPCLDTPLYLLDCRLTPADVARRWPELANYLESDHQVADRYLCRHRKPWYAQENRPAPPILCTYMGRSSCKTQGPFRFILNHSRATATNVYLMLYPRPLLTRELASDPDLLRRIWGYLNQLPTEALLGEGRVYGGGLHKLEPTELSNVQIPFAADLGLDSLDAQQVVQGTLWDSSASIESRTG